MTPAVGYLRVSTDAQVDGYGLPSQRAAVEACADAHGLTLVDVFTDEGVSGTVDAWERDGLAAALNTIQDGRAGTLIVARLDRLARLLHVQEAALAQVWRHGGRVYADGTEVLEDDPDDPMRRAMRQMVGVFGELERAMIAKRMRDGRRAKASAGGYAGGQPGYGVCADGQGGLTVNETEADLVATVLTLREAGMSLRQVGAELEARGWKPRRGYTWHPKVVASIERKARDASHR